MDHYFYHQQQQQQLVNPNPYEQIISSTNTTQDQLGDQRDRDRFPQWSLEETKEFLSLRSELDESFIETKRNKSLWEAISAKLSLRGFNRTPDQCKSKWKNLITRFKGSECMEMEASKFPFHEEMKSIFSKRMERLLKGKGHEEWEDDEEDIENQEEKVIVSTKKRKSVEKKMDSGSKTIKEVEKALRDFMEQQMEMETKWIEKVEAREIERKVKEQEWRRSMEALQRERMELENKWREKEEARRSREEARAERRHHLFVALFNKLQHKGL